MALSHAVPPCLCLRVPLHITCNYAMSSFAPCAHPTSGTTDHHVNVVVAAGNEATDACTETPSSVVRAMTVAAVNSNDRLASFSNYGKCVDVSAPGEGITAGYARVGSVDSVAMLSGTSMAGEMIACSCHSHVHCRQARLCHVLITYSPPASCSSQLRLLPGRCFKHCSSFLR